MQRMIGRTVGHFDSYPSTIWMRGGGPETLFDDVQPQAHRNGLGARRHTKSLEYATNICLYRCLGQAELPGDLMSCNTWCSLGDSRGTLFAVPDASANSGSMRDP